MSDTHFTDYNKLVLCLQCEHREGSHKWGMCYGDWMSCKCEKFQLKIDKMEYERITELLAGK